MLFRSEVRGTVDQAQVVRARLPTVSYPEPRNTVSVQLLLYHAYKWNLRSFPLFCHVVSYGIECIPSLKVRAEAFVGSFLCLLYHEKNPRGPIRLSSISIAMLEKKSAL